MTQFPFFGMTRSIVPEDASPDAPLFVGDYSTGDFNQWTLVQNILHNDPPASYTPAYPAVVEADGTYGYAARYEVRDGDSVAGGERSEVSEGSNTTMPEGAVRWYSFATKFDAAFPDNHISLASGQGWGVVNQWHASGTGGSPPVAFGFRPWSVHGSPYTATPQGYWSLIFCSMDASYNVLWTDAIMHLPMNRGSWNDIKMQICWSASDATGYLRVWLNGVQQTFLGGGTTFTGRTLVPGDGYMYYKEGYYRNEDLTFTGIVHHAGFKSAATEAGVS